jgi:hypothetical protein
MVERYSDAIGTSENLRRLPLERDEVSVTLGQSESVHSLRS